MRSVCTDPQVLDAATQACQPLSDAEWESLPLSVRVACDLSGILILLDGVAADIRSEEGRALRWMDEDLQGVTRTIHGVLQRLAV